MTKPINSSDTAKMIHEKQIQELQLMAELLNEVHSIAPLPKVPFGKGSTRQMYFWKDSYEACWKAKKVKCKSDGGAGVAMCIAKDNETPGKEWAHGALQDTCRHWNDEPGWQEKHRLGYQSLMEEMFGAAKAAPWDAGRGEFSTPTTQTDAGAFLQPTSKLPR